MIKQVSPPNFLFGATTASYQIEGAWNIDGKGESTWDRFAHTPGTIARAESGDVACDHFHHYETDVSIMRDIGLDAYRFSISWPRVMPEGTGRVEARGLDFYDRLIDSLLSAGIRPCATLYHWDLPQILWELYRGWLSRDCAHHFADYASRMFARFGDRVDCWITLNEPKNVHIATSYVHGWMPPCHKGGWKDGLLANHNILLGHGSAVEAFRASGATGRIGVTLAMAHALPLSDSDADATATQRAIEWDVFWNPELVLRGRFSALSLDPQIQSLMPRVEEGDLAIIGAPIDFLGINHYRRNWIREDPTAELGFAFASGEECPCDEFNGIGWPVTPDSIYHTLRLISQRYPEMPLIVTENGYADEIVDRNVLKLEDPERIAFLQRYLHWIHKALEDGIPLEGYFIWSLLDNLEWDSGYAPRFGLVAVEASNQQRHLKASARWLRQFLKNLRMGQP